MEKLTNLKENPSIPFRGWPFMGTTHFPASPIKRRGSGLSWVSRIKMDAGTVSLIAIIIW